MRTRFVVGTLAAVACVASMAAATPISSHGADFQAYNAGEQTLVDFLNSGVRSVKVGSQQIIAAIKRNPITAGSQSYIINGAHVGTQTTLCTVNSYNSAGVFQASSTANATNVSGNWSRTASLTAAQVPSSGHVSVMCSIPGNTNATIYGVNTTP